MSNSEKIPEGYQPLLIDMRKAMWLSVWLLLASLFVGIGLAFLLHGSSFLNRFVTKDPLALMRDFLYLTVIIFLGIFVHELIHGLTWMAVGRKSWKRISYGVCWKYLAPYCHCMDPLSCRTYITGALAPMTVLGVLPLIVSIALGDLLLLVLGAVFISAAAGDVSIACLLKDVPGCGQVLDHPTLPGCLIKEQTEAS